MLQLLISLLPCVLVAPASLPSGWALQSTDRLPAALCGIASRAVLQGKHGPLSSQRLIGRAGRKLLSSCGRLSSALASTPRPPSRETNNQINNQILWPEINHACFCGPDQCLTKFCGQKSTMLVFVVQISVWSNSVARNQPCLFFDHQALHCTIKNGAPWSALSTKATSSRGGQKMAQRGAPVSHVRLPLDFSIEIAVTPNRPHPNLHCARVTV